MRFAARKILACVSCHWGLLHERSVALAAAARRAGGGSRGVYVAWLTRRCSPPLRGGSLRLVAVLHRARRALERSYWLRGTLRALRGENAKNKRGPTLTFFTLSLPFEVLIFSSRKSSESFADRSKMTVRFLEKQSTKFIAKIYCRRQPS